MKLASDLVRMRDDIRRRLGERWSENYQSAREVIQAAMKKNNCNEMAAALKVAEYIQKKNAGTDTKQACMMIIAAAVEMVEPPRL
jgi:hypothetical protein